MTFPKFEIKTFVWVFSFVLNSISYVDNLLGESVEFIKFLWSLDIFFYHALILNNSATVWKNQALVMADVLRILLSSNLYYTSDLSQTLSGQWHYLEKTSFASSRSKKMFLFPNDSNTTLIMAEAVGILLSSNLYGEFDLS